MRRWIILITALLLISGAVACSPTDTGRPDLADPGGIGSSAGSGASKAPSVILFAKVMEVNGASFLAANMAENANSADIYWINTDKSDIKGASERMLKSDALKAGMLVDIIYDGTVMESFPMRLGEVESIYVREEGDDIAGFYMSVINNLYEVDPGLNSEIERIAFDFSGISNLTEVEKTALIYRLGNFYSLETVRGTFDELCEQGYINKEKLYFEKGLLFTVEVTASENNRFTFDAKKWRSGTGAYFYNDCTAVKANGNWTYTVGSEAIS